MTELTKEKLDLQSLLPSKEPVVAEGIFQYPKLETPHYSWSPSQTCRENTAKLAAYLIDLPDHYSNFSMDRWFIDGLDTRRPLYAAENGIRCGTVACACGHGPAAGIEPETSREGISWTDYGLDKFACQSHRAFSFFFDGDWACYDNTPQGAGRRLEYALQHGLPVCYKEKWISYLEGLGLKEAND